MTSPEGCVDFVVIGEGEVTFSELLNTIKSGVSYGDVDGLAYVDSDGVHINKDREFADLSTFPVIDWSLVQPEKYVQYFFGCKKMIYVYGSKGCPGKCTFCNNPTFHRSTHRTRPPEHLIDEIEYLIKNCGIDSVNFADEYWHPSKEDRQKFFDLIKERDLDFVWGCDSRIGQYTRDDLQMMYDAQCRWILFGVESGSKSMLNKINKGISIDDVEENVNNCIEIGITPITTFIVGLPGETVEQVKETVSLAMRIKSKLVQINYYFPIPGSDLQRELLETGKYEPPETLKKLVKAIAQNTIRHNYS